jgi:hypothetical protein
MWTNRQVDTTSGPLYPRGCNPTCPSESRFGGSQMASERWRRIDESAHIAFSRHFSSDHDLSCCKSNWSSLCLRAPRNEDVWGNGDDDSSGLNPVAVSALSALFPEEDNGTTHVTGSWMDPQNIFIFHPKTNISTALSSLLKELSGSSALKRIFEFPFRQTKALHRGLRIRSLQSIWIHNTTDKIQTHICNYNTTQKTRQNICN